MTTKATAFPDDIWSMIKGFLFEKEIECYSGCKNKMTNKNAKDFLLVKNWKNNISVISKLSGKIYNIGNYAHFIPPVGILKEINSMPLNLKVEDVFVAKPEYAFETHWFCKKCWSAAIFNPYDIKPSIENYMEHTNEKFEDLPDNKKYSKIEKECMKLRELFWYDEIKPNKSIFDKQRLTKTQKKYNYYIKCMREYLILEYNENKNRNYNIVNSFKTFISENWNYIQNDKRKKRITPIFVEMFSVLVAKDFLKKKITLPTYQHILRNITEYNVLSWYRNENIIKEHIIDPANNDIIIDTTTITIWETKR